MVDDLSWLPNSRPSLRFPVYTRSNANDVLPDPISPLGGTLTWEGAIIGGYRDGMLRNGAFSAEELADPNRLGTFFHSFFYINASLVRVFGERSGAGAAGVDSAFFGNRPDTPPYVPHPEDRSEAAMAQIQAQIAWVMSTSEWPELEASKRQADGTRLARPDLSSMSNTDLVAHARRLQPLIRQMFADHVVSSSNTAVGPAVLGGLTAAIDPELMLRLIASPGDVDSARPSFALWDISRRVRQSPPLSAAFDAGVLGLRSRLESSEDEEARTFLASLESFLAEYGSRGPNEWDIYSDVWETRPELVVALIDRMRLAPDSEDPNRKHEAGAVDRERATGEALVALGEDEDATALLVAAQASALRFLRWRERSKTNVVKVLHEQRMALDELGRRAAATGDLPSSKHVYMLRDDELDAFISDPRPFGPMLSGRYVAWKALWELEAPYFVQAQDGLPPVESFVRKADRSFQPARPGDVLVGGPGSPGIARGAARMLSSPSDPGALRPGDILVAPNTDPSWTPLFLAVSAVVVDVGAMNSHAVIISRELGIPCAVGVSDASGRIIDGQMIEVDGGAGTVRIL